MLIAKNITSRRFATLGGTQSTFTLNDPIHVYRDYGHLLLNLFTDLATDDSCGLPVQISINAGGVNTACISRIHSLRRDLGMYRSSRRNENSVS